MVLEGDTTVVHELLEGHGSVRDVQVKQATHVGRMVEVQDLTVAVVGLPDELQEDLHHLEQELPGDRQPVLRVVWQ